MGEWNILEKNLFVNSTKEQRIVLYVFVVGKDIILLEQTKYSQILLFKNC